MASSSSSAPAEQASRPEAAQILGELIIFLVLVAASEATRFICRKVCPKHVKVLKGLLVCSLVLLWYSVSITLVLFNKWIVTSWRDGLLDFPIFYSMTHMFLKGVFAGSWLRLVRCRPFPRVSWKAMCSTAFIGMATGIDVALSNSSFLYISVSFYTMLKSASLIFILVMGVVVKVEPCSLKICAIILLISGGIFLTSYGEAEFDLLGFSLVISSEAFAAARWIVTQIVVQHGKLDAMTTVFLMAPGSTLSLAPLVAAVEREKILALSSSEIIFEYSIVVIFPGLLAFALILVEVSLVKVTSSLTLSVFGNLKSIVTVLFAIVLFGEKATPLQFLGLAVALSGIFAYSYIKKRRITTVDSVAFLGYDGLPFEDVEEEAEGAEPDGWSDWGTGASAWIADVDDLAPDEILAQGQARFQAAAFGFPASQSHDGTPQKACEATVEVVGDHNGCAPSSQCQAEVVGVAIELCDPGHRDGVGTSVAGAGA